MSECMLGVRPSLFASKVDESNNRIECNQTVS